ncbi:unnamed protein product [Larinioides sclopetarius]|uniref:THAP-type domain-containing protein n=1 Tax=Larinioides sclopetarius TaxID=280406 RepID=A0AAV2BIH4_9ARAC
MEKTHPAGKEYNPIQAGAISKQDLWEKQLRRENFKSNNNTRICSKHFEAECFGKEQYGRKRLKPDAIPTKFEFPDHLQRNEKPRKRRIEEGECSTVTVVSANRKKFRYIGDFEEKDMESPTKARKLLSLAKSHNEISRKKIQELRRRNRSLVKKVLTLEEIIRKMKEKVLTLEEIIRKMKKKALISDSAGSVLKLSVPDGSCSKLLQRLQKNGCKEYPPELRAFALTLSFYSNKAYKYVRKVFLNALPHHRTLRKWYKSIDGEPGFTSAALSALQMKALDASKNNKRVLCALMVDEMSIKKHIEWDGKKFCGYVDLGTDIDDDQMPIATQAYTFLLNSVNGNWKIPIGYFLIDGLDANERANLIRKSLEMIHETGIDVISLTFDGTSVNLSTAHCLGCTFDSQSLKTSFKHPISDKDICVLLDPSHMMKLIRNTLASKGSLFDGNGNIIKWDYIVSLHKIQHHEGLLLATKLRTRHIEWKREKMKVKLATQVLSASVADALLYLANDLKLPEFKGCEATAEFLKCFNTLFDILNSRNILSKGFKAPLQKFNTEKDHIELFFSAVRSKGGFNNNPTAKQFKAAYVRLLCHQQIMSSEQSNCLPLDDTHFLNFHFSSSVRVYCEDGCACFLIAFCVCLLKY